MGTVYLVGAGPGDPGLLTVRAAELLERAGAVVHEPLVAPEIVERAERAEKVSTGGSGDDPRPMPQADIGRLLVDLAGRHETVVRLKAGDPFVFGRGGEEALALRRAGVPFEVVPGVTAGVAAPACAGIPVTHHGLSATVTLVTGHEDPSRFETALDWTALAAGSGTLVFYTSAARMAESLERLIEAGRPPETPAAAIERGTHPRQRTVVGTLATLPGLAREAAIGAPSLVVVGDVVSLRGELEWLERRPLAGRRIVVTRAREQAGGFAARLAELGAEVVRLPAIRIEDPEDPRALRAAAAEAGAYDWVVFTSANGVERFFAALSQVGADARSLAPVGVCAIGPATAEALAERGVRADLVPGEHVGEAVVEALATATDLAGKRILLPRASVARAALPEGLRARGAEVVEVAAYRTVRDGAGADEVRRRLSAGEIDLVTFTASSTVRGFVDLVGADLGSARVASIGPVTSATARELGMRVDVEAREYTVPGLVRAIQDFYAGAAG